MIHALPQSTKVLARKKKTSIQKHLSAIKLYASMKVKIFTDTDVEKLEKKVNEFLLSQMPIINIKLATSEAKDDKTQFTTLIMY
jgi:hypothetical protein